jgi:hypothetical protein
MFTRSSLALAALAVAAGTATAAAPTPTMRISRISVRFGQPLVVSGRHWPARKGCPRRVTLRLSGGQQRFTIGRAQVSRAGRWSFRYVPRAAKVRAFRWGLTAGERCRSPRLLTSAFTHVRIHA